MSQGYVVVLIFIGLDSADLSRGRVMERVEAGAHDVPVGLKLSCRVRILWIPVWVPPHGLRPVLTCDAFGTYRKPELHELERGIDLGSRAHALRTLGSDLCPSLFRWKPESPEGLTALCVVAPGLIDDGDEAARPIG